MADEKPTEGPRSFARFLENIGDGDLLAESSAKLFELGNALQDESLRTNDVAKGEITLKLKISCDPRGVLGIVSDVSVKKPKPKRVAMQAWITKHGNVSFEHPRQTKLPLQEVSRPKPVEAPSESGAVKEA